MTFPSLIADTGLCAVYCIGWDDFFVDPFLDRVEKLLGFVAHERCYDWRDALRCWESGLCACDWKRWCVRHVGGLDVLQ